MLDLHQVCEVDADVIDAALAAVLADDGEEEPTIEDKKDKKKMEKGEKRKRIDFEDAHNHDEDEDEEGQYCDSPCGATKLFQSLKCLLSRQW